LPAGAASVTTDAVLLRAVDYRDADRVLTLFTQELGKISAIARGARASKRRFSGTLEPYAVIRVGLTPTRSDLFALDGAEVVRVFSAILSDLDRMEAAAGALTLVRESREVRISDRPLFLAVVQFLQLVDHEGDVTRARLLAFAMRVLSLNGMAPRLDVCGRSDEPVPANKPAYFDPALGAVVARRFGGGPFLLDADTRQRLLAAQGEDWLQVARHSWQPDSLQNARAALAAFVASQLGDATAARLFPST
jgi:DNA repair protein RecO (recombination protein O)